MKSLLVIALSVALAPGYPKVYKAKVINVIDGNTLEVLTEDHEQEKIMLKGVDCPELSQEFGDDALRFTVKLVLKKKVTVELKGKDRWGNKLAIIRLKNGKILHEELLKKGLAWAHNGGVGALAQLQAGAQQHKFGLWANENPTPPWVYRRKQTMIHAKSMD